MVIDEMNYIERAAECWRRDQALEAGRLIFENLPTQSRPNWASRILRLVVVRSGLRFSPIENMLHIGDHVTEWRDAHRAFSAIRKSTLDLEKLHGRSHEHELLLRNLYLAENVAKVTYNATDPPDAFDGDSGWWVVSCLKSVLDLLNDDKFAGEAWLAVTRKG